MAWSFRKRIKIIPGVHLNFSRSGISTSIGVKGASVTFGKSGTYLNTSLPALGLSSRQKINGSNDGGVPDTPRFPLPLEYDLNSSNIFSADIHEITSQNMQGIKEAIVLAMTQKSEIEVDLGVIEKSLANTRFKLILSYIFLYGYIYKSIPEALKRDIDNQKEAIVQAGAQIKNCHVELELNFEPEIQAKYEKMCNAFKQMANSEAIWDVTSSHYQDRVVTRSPANTLVNKRNVRFGLKSLVYIQSDFQALYFQNANGADLYFYPGFVVMFSNAEKFAVIGFDEIDLQHNQVRFVETGIVPKDSKVIDKTWAKVNKNGTPDKRFKGNYQIPIARYGEISLSTSTGLNEAYQFSNHEASSAFESVFKDYQNTITNFSPDTRRKVKIGNI